MFLDEIHRILPFQGLYFFLNSVDVTAKWYSFNEHSFRNIAAIVSSHSDVSLFFRIFPLCLFVDRVDAIHYGFQLADNIDVVMNFVI